MTHELKPITIATDWCKNDNLVAQYLLSWPGILKSHQVATTCYFTTCGYLSKVLQPCFNFLWALVSFYVYLINSGKQLKQRVQGGKLFASTPDPPNSTRHSRYIIMAMSSRRRGRCTIGFILFVTFAFISSLTYIPTVSADVDAERHEEKAAEAVVDASGDVQIMDEPDGDDDDDDDGHSMAEDIAAAAAVVEAEASELLAAAEAKAAEFAEEAAAVAKEVKKEGVAFMKSAKDKITTLVDKTKEITPAQMKKVAAGALGVWGVAAGVGWAMNHFSGSDADV
jgi:hypothetical protein